jgi:hypothetical protein
LCRRYVQLLFHQLRLLSIRLLSRLAIHLRVQRKCQRLILLHTRLPRPLRRRPR